MSRAWWWFLVLTGCEYPMGPQCGPLDYVVVTIRGQGDEPPVMPDPPLSSMAVTVTRLESGESAESVMWLSGDAGGPLVLERSPHTGEGFPCQESWWGWSCYPEAPRYGSCKPSGAWAVSLRFDERGRPVTFSFEDDENARACPWPDVCFVVGAE